jgi:hypothetical protein
VIGVARDGNRDLRGSRRRDHCCGRPVERSAIPAKSDRGLSGSATVRSYSQVPRTTRGRIGRHLPPTAWAGRRCAAQAGPPVGGGNVGHWKWRNTSFPRGFWKSFPTDLLEMEEVQGSRHFQISSAISADMEASQTGDVVNSSMTKTESR